MKLFICLTAMVCAVSFVSAKSSPLVPENTNGPFLTHEEIVVKLNEKPLSPAQTLYLITSYGGKGYTKPLIGDWFGYTFDKLYHGSWATCEQYLADRHLKCHTFAKANDGSVLFHNLMRFCYATRLDHSRELRCHPKLDPPELEPGSWHEA